MIDPNNTTPKKSTLSIMRVFPHIISTPWLCKNFLQNQLVPGKFLRIQWSAMPVSDKPLIFSVKLMSLSCQLETTLKVKLKNHHNLSLAALSLPGFYGVGSVNKLGFTLTINRVSTISSFNMLPYSLTMAMKPTSTFLLNNNS